MKSETFILEEFCGKTHVLDTLPTVSPEGLQEPKLAGATLISHSAQDWARALTSSASLVMGYLSRLEITSNTATMFRI